MAASACADSGPGVDGELVVSAAASLRSVFASLADEFEARSGVEVTLNIGGSSSLGAQIIEGAPVDLFASVDHLDIARVVDAGLTVGEPEVFALNHLNIAVPPGNPGGIGDLEDFADANRLLGLCTETVPCGYLAREVLAGAGVTPSVDTEEPDVRALVTKIEAGELDAGIVYLTDVMTADVDGVAIPPELNIEVEYVAVLVTAGSNPGESAAFLSFLLSPEGRRIIASHGFDLP